MSELLHMVSNVDQFIENCQNIEYISNQFNLIKREVDANPQLLDPLFHGKLQNIGNTCYLNSVIQCLRHLPIFNRNLMDILSTYKPSENNKERLKKFIFVVNYLKIIIYLNTNNNIVSPIGLKTILVNINSNYIGHTQHDAHELLIQLLDIFHSISSYTIDIHETGVPRNIIDFKLKKSYVDLKNSYCGKYSNVLNIINSQHEHIIQCSQETCQKTSIMFDSSSCWELPIPNSLQRNISLYDCIDTFTKSENIEYLCEHCNVKGISEQNILLWKTGQILFIKLNKFYIPNVNANVIVSLPEVLDLSKFFDNDSMFRSPTQRYNLVSTICHVGSMDSGHYYTCTLNTKNMNGWTIYNDHMSMNIDTSKVINNPATYMAVYQMN